MSNETPQPEQPSPERETRPAAIDLRALTQELGFTQTPELEVLAQEAVEALAGDDPEAGLAALAAYREAAGMHVMENLPEPAAQVGLNIACGTLLLEAGRVNKGLDELWESAYQAGQTPGIESLREALEEFVNGYEAEVE
jgi:hypothetical protein